MHQTRLTAYCAVFVGSLMGINPAMAQDGPQEYTQELGILNGAIESNGERVTIPVTVNTATGNVLFTQGPSEALSALRLTDTTLVSSESNNNTVHIRRTLSLSGNNPGTGTWEIPVQVYSSAKPVPVDAKQDGSDLLLTLPSNSSYNDVTVKVVAPSQWIVPASYRGPISASLTVEGVPTSPE